MIRRIVTDVLVFLGAYWLLVLVGVAFGGVGIYEVLIGLAVAAVVTYGVDRTWTRATRRRSA